VPGKASLDILTNVHTATRRAWQDKELRIAPRVLSCMSGNHKDFGFYACASGCVIAAIIEFSMLLAAVI
jgi:hypothetical protein